jgi:hypothetical protein
VSKTEPLTNSGSRVLTSPVSSRGRGTTGGGGKTVDTDTARALMGSRLGLQVHPKAMSRIMNSPGCGVSDHDNDCLCDVHIKQSTPISIALPDQMMYATVICEHMDFCAPWDTEKLLKLLGMCSRAHDMLHDGTSMKTWRHNQKVTDDAREFITRATESGMRNTDVIKEVKEQFGIEISQSYISKRRYIYNGTKGSRK